MIWEWIGGLIIAATVVDLFFTVLIASHSRALIIPWVNLGVWHLFRCWAYRGGATGNKAATFCGPLLVMLAPIVWFGLLTLGFACIYYPQLGTGIQASSGPTNTSFFNALYYSGFCFSTLGLGDLEPETHSVRMLTIVQAISGFGVLTLTLTYFQSVFTHVVGKNAAGTFAHALTGYTGDAAAVLRNATRNGTVADLELTFMEKLSQIKEAHHAYPILQYFRFPEIEYSLPRLLYLALDFSSLQRAHASLHPEPDEEIGALRQLCLRLQGDLYPSLQKRAPQEQRNASALNEENWRRRFQAALETLGETSHEKASIKKAADLYVESRSQWAEDMLRVYYILGYHWQEVDHELARVAEDEASS